MIVFKNSESSHIPIPENRVKNTVVFQIIDIDMAGSQFLIDYQISWDNVHAHTI